MSDHDSWFRVGHVTYADDRTGCTVVLFDTLVPAVVDVRGGAPGTRETELLQPGCQVGQVDAIVLTGSSAFGLATADGVVRWLAERGRGFSSAAGPIPIVPAAVIFDLLTGTPRKLTADDGYAAASSAPFDLGATGAVGVGAGATVAKLGGVPVAGGLGIATATWARGEVTAIVAVNAVGDVRDPEDGRWLARTADPQGLGRGGRDLARAAIGRARTGENTTIGVVLLSEPASRDTLVRCSIAAQDALARCVVPAHTLFDGDTFFVAAPQDGPSSPVEILAWSATTEVAVERAIRSAFGSGSRSS